MWVKICGTTRLDDAQRAIDAGADALGFVFAPSPRQVTGAQVGAITRHLPPEVARFGIFVNPALEELVAAVEEGGLSGVQIHGMSGIMSGIASGGGSVPALADRIRARLAHAGAAHPSLIGVVHFEQDSHAFAQALAAAHSAFDAVLIDSRTATAEGGTGLPFDWQAAQRVLAESGKPPRLIVAGGLNPENVSDAISQLHPWGVDVVTGVEAAPGRKDPDKLRAFVKNARSAGAGLATSRLIG
jgi:phosphoribosylanthranilate isomerase